MTEIRRPGRNKLVVKEGEIVVEHSEDERSIFRKNLAEYIAQHKKDLCLTPMCPKRLMAGESRTVTREQVRKAVEKYNIRNEGDMWVSMAEKFLADLGIEVKEKKS